MVARMLLIPKSQDVTLKPPRPKTSTLNSKHSNPYTRQKILNAQPSKQSALSKLLSFSAASQSSCERSSEGGEFRSGGVDPSHASRVVPKFSHLLPLQHQLGQTESHPTPQLKNPYPCLGSKETGTKPPRLHLCLRPRGCVNAP